MSRRRRATKRETVPDPVYGSNILAKFINKVMDAWQKIHRPTHRLQCFRKICQESQNENPLEAFENALENAKPSLEVKSRRIGGATYQVPVEIPATAASPWPCAGSLSIPEQNPEAPWKKGLLSNSRLL